MRHGLFLLLLWFAINLPAVAQVWQRDPVLSELRVWVLQPDSAGFIWVGTDRGVYRYDGYQAVPLNDLLTDQRARLPGRQVLALTFAGGSLWIGTDNGLYAYAAGRLSPIVLPAHSGGRNVNVLRCHPATGRLWVGYGISDAQVVMIDPHSRKVLAVPHLQQDGATRSLIETADGGMWALGENTALRFDAAAQLRERVNPQQISWTVDAVSGRVVNFSRTAQLTIPGLDNRWRIDRHHLYRVGDDGQEQIFQSWHRPNHNPLHPEHPTVITTFQIDSTWYWLGCEKKMLKLTWGRHKPPRVESVSTPMPYLVGYYEVGRSSDGLLWTYNASLSGCFKQRLRQASVQALPVADPAISARAIVRLPDKRLLVGSYTETWIQAADSPDAPLRHTKQVPGVVRAALQTRRGDWLLANEYHNTSLLGRLDPKRLTVQRLIWEQEIPAHGNAYCLWEDHNGQVWAGTSFGLLQIDMRQWHVKRYSQPNTASPLQNSRVFQIAEAPAGVLWLATNNGLFRLETTSGQLRRYGPDEAPPYRLPTTEVLTLTASHPDSIWLGTLDQGLLLVNPRRGVVRQLTPMQGLPSAEISSILPDPQTGTLWLGTTAGLVRYQSRTGQMVVLTDADGLATNEMNRGSAGRDPLTGDLFFGGVGGVSRLNPRQTFTPPLAPRLLLTRLAQHHAEGDTVLTTWLAGRPPADGIRLGPRDLFAEVEFALTDHDAPQLARYSYRLVGSPDRRFRPLGTDHILRLQGLVPGDYILEIRGETRQGVAARNMLRIPLVVADLWWRRPWAWALGAMVLAGTVYLIQRARFQRLLREQQLRTRIATDLHDEVGALLTRVNLQAELLHATGATPNQLGKLLDDSRAAVSTMRDVVWSIDAQADTAGALLDRMRDHLDRTAEPADLLTDLHVEGLQDTDPLPAQVRQHLYLIFKEAVTNAVRHGRDVTRLEVRLKRNQDHLTLEVSNDGAVMTNAAGRSGLGLRSMSQRAQALGGTLKAGPLPEGGYRVRVDV